MAGFQTKTFSNHDDYMTPKSAWQNIAEYIPKDKQIWEAFYGDGTSAENLKELGFNVVSEPIDFYKEDRGEIIVTNPPFSDCKNVFERLAILDKPFIMILPVSKMNTNYFRDWLDDMEAAHPEIQDQIQIIVPRKRIQFIKIENGKRVQMKSCCNFDCYYYCHRMNLPRSIIHLPNEKPEAKPEKLEDLTCDQLKQRLRAINKPVGGRKADLIQRIREHERLTAALFEED